jgi:protein SCO1/2
MAALLGYLWQPTANRAANASDHPPARPAIPLAQTDTGHGDHGMDHPAANADGKTEPAAHDPAHTGHGDHGMDHPAANADGKTEPAAHDHAAMVAAAPTDGSVDVEEKIGDILPEDIRFSDENGSARTLGQMVDKPTIIAFIFYHCPTACPLIQSNLAHALNSAPVTLGRDFQVLSVSFDPEDTPQHAREARKDYTGILKTPPPDGAWRFLTGSQADIHRLTDAAGFRYIRQGSRQFVHPNVLMVISPSGKIIRYLHGTEYLPFDIGMAVTEASRETPGVSIRKMLSYCFDYDRTKNRYAFNLFKVFGAVTLTVLGVFLFFLLRKKPTSGQRSESTPKSD